MISMNNIPKGIRTVATTGKTSTGEVNKNEELIDAKTNNTYTPNLQEVSNKKNLIKTCAGTGTKDDPFDSAGELCDKASEWAKANKGKGYNKTYLYYRAEDGRLKRVLCETSGDGYLGIGK